jgi:hypothetical protein
MPLSFPDSGTLEVIVGRTPWSERVPLDPLCANAINLIQTEQADEGVGCGPGGPPHQEPKLSGIGKTKWHWDAILPHNEPQLIFMTSLDNPKRSLRPLPPCSPRSPVRRPTVFP